MVISSLAAIMPPWRGKSTYPGCSVLPNHLCVDGAAYAALEAAAIKAALVALQTSFAPKS
jgi:hypothetical protein